MPLPVAKKTTTWNQKTIASWRMKTKAQKCETRNEDDAETRYIRKRSNRSWREIRRLFYHELFSRAALRGTYPPFIRAFEQLRRSEEEKGGARVDSEGVPSVAAIEPRLLVRILQTFHRVANALDQNSHETGAPSGARDISSSSRAPISIVATLFALQICDKVNAFGLAPPLAVHPPPPPLVNSTPPLPATKKLTTCDRRIETTGTEISRTSGR